MSDKEKFEALKERAVKENEEQYGREVREKYGDKEVDASNRKILNMSEEEWQSFRNLEEEIRHRLEAAVRGEISAETEEGRNIVLLHKEWLMKTWKQYSVKAHEGLGRMYIADERFLEYYDKKVSGCAGFLSEAISYWAGRIV